MISIDSIYSRWFSCVPALHQKIFAKRTDKLKLPGCLDTLKNQLLAGVLQTIHHRDKQSALHGIINIGNKNPVYFYFIKIQRRQPLYIGCPCAEIIQRNNKTIFFGILSERGNQIGS